MCASFSYWLFMTRNIAVALCKCRVPLESWVRKSTYELLAKLFRKSYVLHKNSGCWIDLETVFIATTLLNLTS